MAWRVRLVTRTCLLGFALVLAPAASQAQNDSGFTEAGATACIDCHETDRVMGILKTAHAKTSDPNTPASQEECQSCHGPSATHIQFPMQVENLHFGTQSNTKPEVQNQACLECHAKGARETWNASAHGFEQVVCSTCHGIHDPDKVVPHDATLTRGCSTEGCHGDLMADAEPTDFSHAVGRPLDGQGTLTCAGCHNPHGPLSSSRCVDCHEQTAETAAAESEKARRFHEVAEKKGTECMRCHKGIAHPIPPLAKAESEAEMRRHTSP